MYTQRLVFGCQRAMRVANVNHIRPRLAMARRRTRKLSRQIPRGTMPSLESGGDSGARTRSLRLAKPALSQLSYIPAANRRGRPPRGPGALVGLGGLEPPTSRLSGVRSNQLSYRPTLRIDAEEIEPVETLAAPTALPRLDPVSWIRAWPNSRGTRAARPMCRPGARPCHELQKERE